MTPPPSILASVMSSPWFRNARKRRLAFLIVAVLMAVLSIWPRKFEARAELKPSDNAGGLSSMLGQSGGLASLGALLGSHDSIETDLAIARSQAALRGALARLPPTERLHLGSGSDAEIAIRKKIDVSALRGSILQISAHDGDPIVARDIVAAYAAGIQDRLASLNVTQTEERKTVAVSRLAEASARLARAQTALTHFRTQNKLAAPELQIGSAVGVLASLQAKLEEATVQLRTTREFATPGNVQVQALEAEIASIKNQINEAQSSSGSSGGPTLGDISGQTAEYLNLFREEKIAATLSQLYTGALEQITVDELSANNSANLVEPPYVLPERQYNMLPVGLLLLAVLAAVTSEFYAITPPAGRR